MQDSSNKPTTLMLKEIYEQPRVLSTLESANQGTLLELTAELKERKITHASFAARGTSDHASIFGQYLLGVYKGVVTALAIPSCITLYNGKPDYSNDLVIAVSQSGKAADALAVIESAKTSGAVTLAITNDENSILAKTAKYHLFCNAGIEESVAATKTFTAQMYLLALLTAYWSNNKDLLSDLQKIPVQASNLLSSFDEKISRQVDRFRYIKEGFILARGYCYPIALEAALKVQETCYIKMKGYATSDFYHGPLAQVDTDIPVIIFAPKGKAFEDSKAMITRITELGTEVLVVTDDTESFASIPNTLHIPDTGTDMTAAFMLAIFAQYFAQCLSISKGLNPDNPRLLKKVTITR